MEESLSKYALALPQRSRGLLSGVRTLECGLNNTVLLFGQYDVSAFDMAVFEEFSLPYPDRLAKAVDKRRAEFLAGRLMAQAAQIALCRVPQPVASGEDRAPVWPEGLAGSISHAREACACILSTQNNVTLGVDTERVASGSSLHAILKQTLLEEELALLGDTSMSQAVAATLVFSAKEALFKAVYPHVKHHFGFDCAALVEVPSDTHLTLRFTKDVGDTMPAGRIFDVSYIKIDTHMLTWLAVS